MGVPNTLSSKIEPSVVQETTEPLIINQFKAEQDATDNKLEEGEIFDDFEDIISSDEEFSMRKRIEELESRNAELEKIANLSAFFDNSNFEYVKNDKGFKYKKYIETIELSDYDDYEKEKSHHVYSKRTSKSKPSKSQTIDRKRGRKSIRSRSRKRKYDSKDYRSDRSDDLNVPRGYRTHRKKSKQRSNRKYLTSSKKSLLVEQISSSEDELFRTNLDRGDLNLALSRDKGHKIQKNLKERLQQKKNPSNVKYEINGNANNERQTNDESYESTGLEEEELRMIALKSAINKKYVIQQNELTANESAYSPSDFDHITAALKSNPSPKNEELSLTICNSMEISPIMSPQTFNDDKESIENCCTKPVDMDIVSSNSESEYPLLFGVENKWIPIETKQTPSDKEKNQIIYVPEPKLNSSNSRPEFEINAKKSNNNIVFESNQSANISDNEEEVTALRELLLSNLNKNKKVNQIKNKSLTSNYDNIGDRKEKNESFSEESTENKTESILKDAVRRLIAQTSQPEQNSNDVVLGTKLMPNEINAELSLSLSKSPSNIPMEKKEIFQTIDQNENRHTINKFDNKNEDKSLEFCNLVVTVRYNQDNTTTNSVQSVKKCSPGTTNLSTSSTKLVKPINSKSIDVPSKSVNISKIPKVVHEVVIKSPVKESNNKIVDPKTMALKRKTVESTSLSSQKKLKYSNSRLIGNIEVPKVNPLIIRLNDSDSDDIHIKDYNDTALNHVITINNDYFDNASPISLQMVSPCCTPRSNSPNVMSSNVLLSHQINVESSSQCSTVINKNTTKVIKNDVFEAKLDEFLKNARNNVQTLPKKIIKKNITIITPSKTPVFVKHLPKSAQIEYQYLMQRMKMLEKQKEMETKIKKANLAKEKKMNHSAQHKTKSLKTQETVIPSCYKESTNQPVVIDKPIPKTDDNCNNNCLNNKQAELSLTMSGLTQPLFEESQENSLNEKTETDPNPIITKEILVQPKSEILKKYESAYEKKGFFMKHNLKEYLALSDHAKTCNTKNRLIKDRMFELRKELESIEKQLEENKQETTKYLSSMSLAYIKILDIQSNRDKLLEITNRIGQKVKGNSYSVPGDDKEIKQLMQKVFVEKNLIENFQKKKAIECNKIQEKQTESNCKTNNDEETTQSINVIPKEKTNCLQIEMPKLRKESGVVSSLNHQKEISATKTIIKPNSAITNTNQNKKKSIKSVIQAKENIKTCPSDLVQSSSKSIETNNEKDMNKIITTKNNCDNIIHNTPIPDVIPNNQFCDSDMSSKDGPKETDKDIVDDTTKSYSDTSASKYLSPLFWLTEQQELDVNGVLCPFQLKGQCADKECTYKHL